MLWPVSRRPRDIDPQRKNMESDRWRRTGLLGGFSSFYGPPIAFYLLMLKLPRDAFIVTSALISRSPVPR